MFRKNDTRKVWGNEKKKKKTKSILYHKQKLLSEIRRLQRYKQKQTYQFMSNHDEKSKKNS